MKDIRIVIWDCDNLMWMHRKDEPERVAQALGIKDSDIEEFTYEFYDMFSSFMSCFENKKVTILETYKHIENKIPILECYGISAQVFLDVHNVLKVYLNDFNVETLELMKYFRGKNIKCIVKTDWFKFEQQELLKHYGVLEYIEELHCCDNNYLKSNPLSSEGLIKPGTEEQYVMIGDSLTSDVAFAKHAGIKSIWVNHFNKKNDTIYNPTYEVTSLLDIMKII